MALSDQIKEASDKIAALQLILSGVCSKVNEITECYGLLGTDQFQRVLEWQATINQEILILQKNLEMYYQQVDQVRNIMVPEMLPNMTEEISISKVVKPDVPTSKNLQDLLDQLSNDPTKLRKLMELIKKNLDFSKIVQEVFNDCDKEDEEDEEDESEEAVRSNNPSDFLVVEDSEKPSTYHLQVKRNGKPDHNLMGAAWAALHSGFRGNKYEGPDKQAALKKLKALYKSEDMPLPKE
jgi:hypothetical protein